MPSPPPARREAALACVCGVALFWLNAYLCREAFHLGWTAAPHSMHGFWLALARLAPGSHWWQAEWWPYWYGGMPMPFTYAPLIPTLAGVYGRAAGSEPAGFYGVCALVYCLTPVTLGFLAWRLARSPLTGLAAGLIYSLAAPSQWIAPDDRFAWVHLFDARRFLLQFTWDETPHLTAIMLLPLTLFFLWRAWDTRRLRDFTLAGACVATSILASAYAGPLTLLGLVCLAAARTPGRLFPLASGAFTAAVAWFAVMPQFPPELIAAISFNDAKFDPNDRVAAWFAILLAAAVFFAVWHVTDKYGAGPLGRFACLFSAAATVIVLLHQHYGRRFVPQPGRYKIEMEWGIALLAAWGLTGVMRRAGPLLRVALVLLLAAFAVQQTASLRQFAKRVLRETDIRATIEYRVARWAEQRYPGQRVMLGGSVAAWANAFTGIHQMAGGSYPTAFNPAQLKGVFAVYDAETAEVALPWLKAFGAAAVMVSGPDSQEFWKPYRKPDRFEGVLPAVFREGGVTIYEIPGRAGQLAHLVPPEALVPPVKFDDMAVPRLARYVNALDDPALPPVTLQWRGHNRFAVRIPPASGRVLSVQVNHHDGWRATTAGRPVAIARDGIGQMVLRPECPTGCEIEFFYGGGALQRLALPLVLIALAWTGLRRRRAALQ